MEVAGTEHVAKEEQHRNENEIQRHEFIKAENGKIIANSSVFFFFNRISQVTCLSVEFVKRFFFFF